MNHHPVYGFLDRALLKMVGAPDLLPLWWQQTAVAHAHHSGYRQWLLLLACRPEVNAATSDQIRVAAADLGITENVSARIEASSRRNSTDGLEQMSSTQRQREVLLLGGYRCELPSARLTELARAELLDMNDGRRVRLEVVKAAGPSWVLQHISAGVPRNAWIHLQRLVDHNTFSLFCSQGRNLGLPVWSGVVRVCPSPSDLAEHAGVISGVTEPGLERSAVSSLCEAADEVSRRADSVEIVDHVLRLQHTLEHVSEYVSAALLNAAAEHVSVDDLPRLLSGLTSKVLVLWSPRPVSGLDLDGGRWIGQVDDRTHPSAHRREVTRVLADLHDRDGLVANQAQLASRLGFADVSDHAVPRNWRRNLDLLRQALPLDVDVAEGAPLSDTQVGQVVAFVGEDALRLRVLADVVDGAKHITLRDALATAGALLD